MLSRLALWLGAAWLVLTPAVSALVIAVFDDRWRFNLVAAVGSVLAFLLLSVLFYAWLAGVSARLVAQLAGALERVCEEHGLTFVPHTWAKHASGHGRVPEGNVRIYRHSTVTGRTVTRSWTVVSLTTTIPHAFAVARCTALSGVFGQNFQTGDADFDAAVALKGPESELRDLMHANSRQIVQRAVAGGATLNKGTIEIKWQGRALYEEISAKLKLARSFACAMTPADNVTNRNK